MSDFLILILQGLCARRLSEAVHALADAVLSWCLVACGIIMPHCQTTIVSHIFYYNKLYPYDWGGGGGGGGGGNRLPV